MGTLIAVFEQLNYQNYFFFIDFWELFLLFPQVGKQIFFQFVIQTMTEVQPSIFFFFVEPAQKQTLVGRIAERLP